MTAPTRVSRYPDLRAGTTFCHISDMHFGTLYWDNGNGFLVNWQNRHQNDQGDLVVHNNGGFLITGDIINFYTDTSGGASGTDAQRVMEENAYRQWRASVKASANGLTFAEVCGNHDMLGVDIGGVRTGRSAAQWAIDIGLAQYYNAYDFGDCRVLTIAPAYWTSANNAYVIIEEKVLEWLDVELSSDSRPTFIACHVTLADQYGDTPDGAVDRTLNPRITDLIGAHTNLIGWLSGHRHNGIGNSQWAETMTIAGRNLFMVCGPGGGSDQAAGGNAWSRGQFGSHIFTSFLTLLDSNTLDIRFRDHLANSWSYGVSPSETHRLLTR